MVHDCVKIADTITWPRVDLKDITLPEGEVWYVGGSAQKAACEKKEKTKNSIQGRCDFESWAMPCLNRRDGIIGIYDRTKLLKKKKYFL